MSDYPFMVYPQYPTPCPPNKHCTLCPRQCRVNREYGQTGFCGQSSVLKAARAALHMWEEPCISGLHGSGAVFFSGCTLRCVYCQNASIASGQIGKSISRERLIEIFLKLQEMGANNINLVTPTQFVPQIAWALEHAKEQGLTLPVIYNTGSYECVDTLKQMEGLVDVYLPDLKYYSPKLSKRYSHAPDYFAVASKAIEEMVRQTGEPVFQESSDISSPKNDSNVEAASTASDNSDYATMPLITRGVIVRHLVLPGCVEDSMKIMDYLYKTYGNRIYISIMNQYTPVAPLPEYPELNRKITKKEYDTVVDYAISLGVENGFIQEGETASESFIPPFDLTGI